MTDFDGITIKRWAQKLVTSEHQDNCARVSTDLRHLWICTGRSGHVGHVWTQDDIENVREALERCIADRDAVVGVDRVRRRRKLSQISRNVHAQWHAHVHLFSMSNVLCVWV